jgi:hypothetical protein
MLVNKTYNILGQQTAAVAHELFSNIESALYSLAYDANCSW